MGPEEKGGGKGLAETGQPPEGPLQDTKAHHGRRATADETIISGLISSTPACTITSHGRRWRAHPNVLYIIVGPIVPDTTTHNHVLLARARLHGKHQRYQFQIFIRQTLGPSGTCTDLICCASPCMPPAKPLARQAKTATRTAGSPPRPSPRTIAP
jgi:hypothetical protein